MNNMEDGSAQGSMSIQKGNAWYPYQDGEGETARGAAPLLSAAALAAVGPQYGQAPPLSMISTMPSMNANPYESEGKALKPMPAELMPTALQAANAAWDAQRGALANKGGAQWAARMRPVHEQFYYRPTSMQFDAEQVSLMDLVGRVYEFCDREFTVQVTQVEPAKGTFELAVFVRTTMLQLKLRIWQEGESKLVLEVELRDGCCVTFGEVYRALKRTLGDAADALSRTTTEELGGQLSDLDMGGDALKELGSEFEAPTAEEWDSMLCDCEVQAGWDCDASQVAAAVDSLCSVALGYEPADLEPLAKGIADVKMGLVHDCYGSCDAAGCSRQSQLFAVACLVKHLSQEPRCVQHWKSLAPALLKECQTSINQTGCCWHAVLNELAKALCAVLQACKSYGIALSQEEKAACPTNRLVVPADAALKEASDMVQEGRLGSRAAAAQKSLDEAFGTWQQLSA